MKDIRVNEKKLNFYKIQILEKKEFKSVMYLRLGVNDELEFHINIIKSKDGIEISHSIYDNTDEKDICKESDVTDAIIIFVIKNLVLSVVRGIEISQSF